MKQELARASDATAARFIEIDEDGYFKLDGLRVADQEMGRDWLSRIRMERGSARTLINGEIMIVEAFDDPYVALDIEKLFDGNWQVTMPYGHQEKFKIGSLVVDEWDRFHGFADRGEPSSEGAAAEPVPFVLSRQAQSRLFNIVDEFDDDSLTVDGARIEVRPWLSDQLQSQSDQYWSSAYERGDTGWDLGAPSPALPLLVPQLKLQRARILVPGAGTGNDAAWLAEQGHIVTALDFSPLAIAKAKEKYGHLSDLKFMQADVFSLPETMNSAFDIVIEHTLYCAIPPSRRNDLVKVWRRVLIDRGHLLGIFFAAGSKRAPAGPPFGGSEWELRARLGQSFHALYWNRMRESRPDRLGREVFIYAQKTSKWD